MFGMKISMGYGNNGIKWESALGHMQSLPPKLKGKRNWLPSWTIFRKIVGGGRHLLQLREFVTC
jgi:hypothetical protein